MVNSALLIPLSAPVGPPAGAPRTDSVPTEVLLLKPKEETLSEGIRPVVILRWIWSRWAVVKMSHTWDTAGGHDDLLKRRVGQERTINENIHWD